MEYQKVPEILLVEDNLADVGLVREALCESGSNAKLWVTRDGVEALAFLRRVEPYADAPRPDLVLLDLNLPKKNGHELLAEIRADPGLRDLPVVIWTSSESKADIVKAYGLGADSFVTKPLSLAGFFFKVKAIKDFWLRTT